MLIREKGGLGLERNCRVAFQELGGVGLLCHTAADGNDNIL